MGFVVVVLLLLLSSACRWRACASAPPTTIFTFISSSTFYSSLLRCVLFFCSTRFFHTFFSFKVRELKVKKKTFQKPSDFRSGRLIFIPNKGLSIRLKREKK